VLLEVLAALLGIGPEESTGGPDDLGVTGAGVGIATGGATITATSSAGDVAGGLAVGEVEGGVVRVDDGGRIRSHERAFRHLGETFGDS